MTWITQVGFYLLVTAAVSLGKSHVANVGRRGEPRQDFAYPEVRRNESVIDDYYGTQVTDPYRHLEDIDSEEVQKFVEAQNQVTNDYLDDPVKDDIKAVLQQAYNYPRYGTPRRYGSKYYSSMNTGLQAQDVYYVQEGLGGELRVIYDPNELSENGTVHLSSMEFSPDGTLAALALNSQGSDATTVKFRDLSREVDFPDTLEDVRFSYIKWTNDGLGVFYARYPSSGNLTNQKIYYHRLGESQLDDVLAVEFDDPLLFIGFFEITEDGRYLLLFPGTSTREAMVYYCDLEDQLGRGGGITRKLQPIPIVPHMQHEYYYVGSEGNVIYLRTSENANNYKIVSVDISNPSNLVWTTIVQEDERNILETAYHVAGDKVVVKYLVDVTSQVEIRWITNGSFIERLDIPVGTVDVFSGRKAHSEFFFRVVSFLIPGVVFRVDLNESPAKVEVLRESTIPGFQPQDFVVNQVFYPSKDGTIIPMFLVHKRDLQFDGNASTILFGYGGFNVIEAPSFVPERVVFIRNFDGVFALAHIRGGGEYGQRWNEEGRLLKKQNSYDDFQAAAEYLIQEGYTSKSKLAINGVSNGGLMVGACLNQRPDLYAAALSEVGVHDMLRYHRFGFGYFWCEEYGCSDDGNVTIFKNLYRFSPLHNVRMPVEEGVEYPAVLLTTADHDDRVPPLHSYKFIAQLQHEIGQNPKQNNPLLIKIQKDAGHGQGKPVAMKIQEVAEMYTFLVKSAGFVFTKAGA